MKSRNLKRYIKIAWRNRSGNDKLNSHAQRTFERNVERRKTVYFSLCWALTL